MAIIKQVIHGKTVKVINIDATLSDLTELQSILEGEVTLFGLASKGGNVAPLPAVLNRKKFSCGNRAAKISCSFSVPHVKPTAFTPNFEAVVIGAFDANYEVSNKADYMNLLYDRN